MAVFLLLAIAMLLMFSTVRAGAAAATSRATDTSSQTIVRGTGTLGGVTTSPLSMSPAFSTSTTDYAIWCGAGTNNLSLTLAAAPGGVITVGNQSGSQVTVPVSVVENEAIVIDMNGQPISAGYWIRCLPQGFPKLAVSKSGNAPPGYYITGITNAPSATSLYAMVLNQNGTPVWYHPAPNDAVDVTLLPNSSTLVWSPNLGPGVGSDPNGVFDTFNLSTQTSGVIHPPIEPVDPHELQVLPNGDYLTIATPLVTGVDLSGLPSQQQSLRGFTTIVDCVVEEFNPTTGTVDWSWDAYRDGHILPDEDQNGGLITYNGQNVVDMYHCNSLAWSPGGTNVVISARHEDALYDVAVGNKQVLWKLGGDAAVPTGATHMIPTGDPEGTFTGQHDARIMSVSGDQPSQLSLFDDHSFGNAAGSLAGGARGAEYSVDPTAGTAAFLTEFPTGGHATDSAATGSFRVPDLPGGTDALVGWGIPFSGGSEFTEYDSSKSVLMDATFTTGERTYRVIKVPLTSLDLNQLRAAVPSPSTPPPTPTPPTPTPSPTATPTPTPSPTATPTPTPSPTATPTPTPSPRATPTPPHHTPPPHHKRHHKPPPHHHHKPPPHHTPAPPDQTPAPRPEAPSAPSAAQQDAASAPGSTSSQVSFPDTGANPNG